jgi:N-acetyl-gamma-glutamyl-phosphate reductase
MKIVRVGIVGGAGYTGGELIRILIFHPFVEIVFVQSSSNANNHLYQVHADLLGETEQRFTSDFRTDVDVIFLCGGHGKAKEFLTENNIPESVAIIDLSHDFRLLQNAIIGGRFFVYGLPELNRENIIKSKNIANPGCFATAIELALLPLSAVEYLPNEIHVNATTGSTGAGQSLSATSHFSWRSNNMSSYKVFSHQHNDEIMQALCQLQKDFSGSLHFVPQRGAFTRGIFAVSHLKTSLGLEELLAIYANYYQNHPFVSISSNPIDVKQVVNTNKCFIYIEKHQDNVVITSVIDNLIKGASGQAVQNMNLMFGIEETLGLKLKSIAF